MRRGIILALVFLGGSLSGCAFGNRQVTLTYPPENTSGVIQTAEAATRTPANHEDIVIDFVDRRSDKGVIGEVRNGWGMHTADVVAVNGVQKWVSGAVKSELEAAGYSVSVRNPKMSLPPGILLSGEILTVYCTALFSYEGKVSFIAKVIKDNKELIDKRYSGKGSAGLNWAATSDAYDQSLSLALSSAVKQLVKDVENLND